MIPVEDPVITGRMIDLIALRKVTLRDENKIKSSWVSQS